MSSLEEQRQRDAAFAIRLGMHDESVLSEIDSEYSSRLRSLLRDSLGTSLTRDDIDEIVLDSLHDLWKCFTPGRGSIFGFLAKIAKNKLYNHLRSTMRRQKREQIAAAGIRLTTSSDDGPPQQYIAAQRREEVKRISALIELADKALTPLQRQAYLRRKIAGTGEKWAKALENETRTRAQVWRKASDDAHAKIRNFLKANGVGDAIEGDINEVA